MVSPRLVEPENPSSMPDAVGSAFARTVGPSMSVWCLRLTALTIVLFCLPGLLVILVITGRSP